LRLREARDRYFRENAFPADGGYDARWVKLQAGPIPFGFPNTDMRRRAVRFHDLHHVLTGYETTWTGEAEIGAWEVASGCADHWAAWGLNLSAFALGLFFAPRRCHRAFLRGRRSRNLYRETWRESLLDDALADCRARLGLDREPGPARARDHAAFAGWALAGLSVLLLQALIFVGAVALVARLATRLVG
jgi:hypothetical protein